MGLTDTAPLADAVTTIGVGDVVALGGIDEALGAFFSDAVVQAAECGGCSVRVVREWVEAALISVSGFRMQVAHGPSGCRDGGEGVVRALEDAHVVRCDVRGGVRWFELAHDRLVGPVLASNEVWRAQHLAGWQRDALVWVRSGRAAGLLLSGAALAAARGSAGELSTVDEEFLAASTEAERGVQAARRSRRRLRLFAVTAAALAVLTTAAGLVAVNAARSGNQLTDEIAAAQASRDQALAEAAGAVTAADAARAARADAEAQTADATNDLDAARRATADAVEATERAVRAQVEAEQQTDDARAEVAFARAATEAAHVEIWTSTEDANEARRIAATTRAETSGIERTRRQVEAEIATFDECARGLIVDLQQANAPVRERGRLLAGFLAETTFEQMSDAIRSYLGVSNLEVTC